MNKPYESVLSLTSESVAGMAPVELRKLAAKEIHALLAKYQEEGRARSWFSAMLLGVVLPHFFGSAHDAGCGCLNIAVPFLGLGHLVSRSYIMWVLQLALCMGVPFMLWPGHDQFWYAIGVSYALGILLNLLSFFVLKKIAFVLHWLHLARKVRRGLAGLYAGARELVRPFFAKEAEYTAFCDELDTREVWYNHLLQSICPGKIDERRP